MNKLNKSIKTHFLKLNIIKSNKDKKEIKENIIYYEKLKEFDKNSKEYTAIIVEPRKHLALEYVLDNFIENLDEKWRFIIYHSEFNKEYIQNIINNLKIKYNDLYIDTLIIIENNISRDDYSKLLTTRKFYEIIPTETFLIFQTDTLILKQHKHLINEFLEYDYVGAPWEDTYIGNGGLSLRKKTKMIEIIDKVKYNGEAEDIYFCIKSKNFVKMYLPSFEKAKLFSIEYCHNDIAFGIHQIWVNKNFNQLIKKYPELLVLKNLQ